MNNVSTSGDPSSIEIQPRSVHPSEIQQLFADVIKRIDHASLEALKNFIPVDEITFNIHDAEPILLIQFVKQIIFYLSKVKMDLEERVARTSEDDFNNYEKLIQKLEAEVRQHIRVEQQQRLHIENLQQKVEELTQQLSISEDDLHLREREIQALRDALEHRKVSTQLPSTSNNSSAGLKKSVSKAPEKKNTKSKSYLPPQLQALFSKVYDREGNTQSKLNLSTQISKRSQSRTAKYDSQKLSESQEFGKARHTHKDSTTSYRTNTTANVIRNLEAQFIDSEVREEKQSSHIYQSAQQQADPFLSYREKESDDQSKFRRVDQKKLLKPKDKHTRQDSASSKQELSKSSSFDGTSKVLKMYRRELKTAQQNQSTSFVQSQKQLLKKR